MFGESIVVMNEKTFEEVKEKTYEYANTQPDPIVYVGRFASMNIVIDNQVPDNVTEVWAKEIYEQYKKSRDNEQ